MKSLVVLMLVNLLWGSAYGYLAGVGIADTTGPAAEVGMMGYAKSEQKTGGIHTRLFSRAFVIAEEPRNGTDFDNKRIVYVVVDAAMIGQLVKMKVIQKLQSRFGSLYRHDNVMIAATHTHSGPGGFLQYFLFNITTYGFIKQTFWAMVDGIVKSITLAHQSMVPAKLFVAEGKLLGTNVNRSPTSYMANPAEERSKYLTNTDVTMTQLMLFSASDGSAMGSMNWFPVHATSMNNTNRLISSDNKGMASLMLEKKMNPGRILGKGPFVAAFATANMGDASPNTAGPQCRDTGLPCDDQHKSTCKSGSACIAFGPGQDMFDSTKIIAERQFNKAYDLLADTSNHRELPDGTVGFAHEWIDMGNRSFKTSSGISVGTCLPALGYSFAAGTTDGAGEDGFFTQGTVATNQFWRTITGLLKEPSEEMNRCHAPKPILLSTGEMANDDYRWSPRIVDTQIMRIGDLVIAALPGEFTTMAGRRLRERIASVYDYSLGHRNIKIVLSGLSNVYSSYITTFEEYQLQRYEAASTLYGPHTLGAYLDQYDKLTRVLIRGNPIASHVYPPDLYLKQPTSLDSLPIMDAATIGSNGFGDCKINIPKEFHQGDTVVAKFVSGHPRNNLMLDRSYLLVERELSRNNGTGVKWEVVATDADIDTKFIWRRVLFAESEAEVRWDIPQDQSLGVYRIRHFGHHKVLGVARSRPYSGTCGPFKVLPSSERRFNQRRGRRQGRTLGSFFGNMVSKMRRRLNSMMG